MTEEVIDYYNTYFLETDDYVIDARNIQYIGPVLEDNMFCEATVSFQIEYSNRVGIHIYGDDKEKLTELRAALVAKHAALWKPFEEAAVKRQKAELKLVENKEEDTNEPA